MACSSKRCSSSASNHKRKLPYIEPSIRVIAGFFLSLIGMLLYFYHDFLLILIGALLFISLNLFQSGITHYCIMEKGLKLFGFRSELDEIKDLSAEAELAASIQKNYIKTLNLLNEAIVEISQDGTILTASDGWLKLISHNTLISKENSDSILSYIHESDKSLVLDMFKKVFSSEESVHRVRFRLKHSHKTEHWVGGKFMLEVLSDTDIRIRGVLRDITDAYLQEKQIKHMAMHDALTGLPNRVLLDEKMDVALENAKKNNSLLGLLFIDLDNFKQVNDVHGHKMGDHLLVSVSRIMQKRLRDHDTLARWGGDEFVVVLPELKYVSDVRRVAESLMRILETELVEEGFDAIVTLSIGGATYPADADSTETLLVQADKALYCAKDQGRNNVQIYTELRENNLGFYDFEMTNRFTQAIKENKIQVNYQVIVTAENKETSGLEALARWHDEKYGWVSPGIFIPMAENLGLIQDLGKQVLARALEDFSSVCNNSDLVLSVNISNRQIMQGDFTDWIEGFVKKYGVRPEQIKLEITESLAQMDIKKAKKILETLREIGFKLSLDDFGTGFSSLSNLHNLPVDELKIDMSFVQRCEDSDGKIMLETIVAMGHALGLELVAEGVDSAECVKIMQDLGVAKLQGYYFSKPIPWSEASKLFVSNINNVVTQLSSSR
ncbi:diguanylate cyclase/phosphodiesterase (GGDEF & EAL domains) with PAS/PAC sensor(s) [hydrothermal vent metagenome]|uniref:Diguanylate cyclase/phosphodiesterase (GGDEF & EAL domains) with PAS/PAC sensor(S) n=1 Tax=hydrothermal vent metagenome TaxID=652676 RepID=A0A3B1A5C0_9ZZZZ